MPQFAKTARSTWPEAIATVTACTYKVATGRALAFGIPTTKWFRISFSYWAPNSEGTPELHIGELASAKAMHVGTLFPIHYNPDAPHETTHSTAAPTPTGNPLVIIGILGSVVLSFAWFLILRGCH